MAEATIHAPGTPLAGARSPLGQTEATPAIVASGRDAVVLEHPFMVQVDIRLDPAEAAQVEPLPGLRLPLTPNRVTTAGDPRALWLAPDEWLVLAPAGMALEERPGRVDVSAHRTLLEVRGRAARDLLVRGCPLDLDPRSFTADQCAQTLLARVDVILFRLDPSADDSFGVLVRASFARYLVAWLRDAIEGLES
jgi:sarcosine oxidase subunit gamma